MEIKPRCNCYSILTRNTECTTEHAAYHNPFLLILNSKRISFLSFLAAFILVRCSWKFLFTSKLTSMEQTCTVHVQHCQRLKTFLYTPITDLKKTANLTASTLLRVSATACPSSKLLSLYLLATGSNFNTTRQILTFVNKNCSVSLTQDADKVSNLSRIDLSPNRTWLKNSFSFFKV